ncbi:MAG: hypothetical protein Q9188_005954, partial [Gyalolechia gomerana]
QYLDLLQPYTITTRGQRMGRFVLEMTWWPILSAVFGLNKVFCDKQGRSPRWLVGLLGSVFVGIWTSYDGWMKGVFGDGERTIESEEEVGRKKVMKKLVKRRGDEVRAVEKDGSAMICSTKANPLDSVVPVDEEFFAAGQKPSTMHPAWGIFFAAAQRSSREMEGRDEYGIGAWPVGIWVPQQMAQWETVTGERQAEH